MMTFNTQYYMVQRVPQSTGETCTNIRVHFDLKSMGSELSYLEMSRYLKRVLSSLKKGKTREAIKYLTFARCEFESEFAS